MRATGLVALAMVLAWPAAAQDIVIQEMPSRIVEVSEKSIDAIQARLASGEWTSAPSPGLRLASSETMAMITPDKAALTTR